MALPMAPRSCAPSPLPSHAHCRAPAHTQRTPRLLFAADERDRGGGFWHRGGHPRQERGARAPGAGAPRHRPLRGRPWHQGVRPASVGACRLARQSRARCPSPRLGSIPSSHAFLGSHDHMWGHRATVTCGALVYDGGAGVDKRWVNRKAGLEMGGGVARMWREVVGWV